MKYCFTYSKNLRHLEDVDEVIIKYRKKNINLIKFLESKPENQTYIIDITELDDDEIKDNYSILKAAKNKHNKIKIRLTFFQEKYCKDFLDMGFEYFFINEVKTWDILSQFINDYYVSDVYISEEFGFYLKDIKSYAGDINIRVYPNLLQSSAWNVNDIKGFFIRPEDLETVYGEYVDIVEFFCPIDKQPTFYDIYAIDKKWHGSLKEIINGLHDDINSNAIPSIWAEIRLNCHKQCYYKTCKICEHAEALAKVLKKNNLKIMEN